MKRESVPQAAAIVLRKPHEDSLRLCLQSVFAQHRAWHDVFVVDLERDIELETWLTAEYKGRVTYLWGSGNSKISRADHAVNKTDAEFIVCIEAGQWLDPEFHDRLIGPFEGKPGLGITYCGEREITERSDICIDRIGPEMKEFDRPAVFAENIFGKAVMVRKKAWLGGQRAYGVKGPEGKIYFDEWDHWLEATDRGWEAELVRERLAYRNIDGDEQPDEKNSRQTVIRRRHLKYDLSIISFFDEYSVPDQYLAGLQMAEKPASVQILFVDACTNPEISKKLCETGAHYFSIPKNNRNREDWMSASLMEIKSAVRGHEVLFLGSDITLQKNGLIRLLEAMKQSKAAFYAGRSIHEDQGFVSAWRATRGNPDEGLYPVDVSRRPKRVYATGLDCLLMGFKHFDSYEFKARHTGERFQGIAFLTAKAAWKKGDAWYVDGRVPATRWLSSNRRARIGAKDISGKGRLPLVSVIVPAFNCEATLSELLHSLKALDFPSMEREIIVVDNASTDRTRALAETFADVKVVDEPERSSYAARNRGIGIARGKFIAFVDADCIVTKGWLRDLLAQIMRDDDCGAVGAPSLALNAQHWLSSFERRAGGYRNDPGVGSEVKRPSYAITMNIIYRKSVFEDVGLFDAREVSGSDIDMCWRMQAGGRWKLKLVTDLAYVCHRDESSFRKYILRQLRLGRGCYGLYQKYPLARDGLFNWLPQTRRELLFRWLTDSIRSVGKRKKGDRGPLNTVLLRFLRDFLSKWGFLVGEGLHEKAVRSFRRDCPQALIFTGSENFSPASKLYGQLWEFSRRQIPVLHVDPCPGMAVSWKELFVGLLGGTSYWRWSPWLRSIRSWELLPARFQWGRRLNQAINASRQRRTLAVSKTARIHLISAGEDDRGVLIRLLRKLAYAGVPAVINTRASSGVRESREIFSQNSV